MQWSYSRVGTFDCPRKYKYRYVDRLKTIPNRDADNALYLGSALHKGIETTVEEGVVNYLSNYLMMTDAVITQAIMLEHLIPKVKDILPGGGVHEVKVEADDFIGYLDYVVGDTIYDFKYSNAVDRYLKSDQLSIYKYFYEQQTGKPINHLKFVFIPKSKLRQKRTESVIQFRERVLKTLDSNGVRVEEVAYDPEAILRFKMRQREITLESEWKPELNQWCDKYCEYYDLCQNGCDWNIMELPKNTKKPSEKETLKHLPEMYLWGASYVGKSTFADSLDDVLFVNTDGNCDMYKNPYVYIGKTVTMNGRMKVEKSAWENFIDLIEELEKKQNTFKYVCLDLVEDLREYCRVYIQKKLGITHESDSAYSKGWDLVALEFNQAIKRIKAAGYIPLYISKEVVKEVSEKSGAKYTTFAPNIQEKTANMLAGTVKLTARIYADEAGKRWIQLGLNPHVFGGGRYRFKVDKCPLDKDELLKAINDAD